MKEMIPRPSRRRVLQAASMGLGSAVSGCIADLAGETEPEKPERSANAPPLKWISEVHRNGSPWKTPKIHDQTLYSTGYYNLWALDTADGSKRWRYEIDPPSDTPCYNGKLNVADDIISTAGCDEIYAFDEDGEIKWTVNKDTALFTPPTITEEFLFFGGTDLVQLDRTSGTINWKRSLEGRTRAPLVLGGEYLFAGLHSGILAAYDRSTGQKQVTLEPESGGVAAPVFDDGVVFIGNAVSADDGTKTGYLHAADVDEQRWLWRVETGPILSHLPPAVHDDTLFVVNDTGTMYAISTTDGTIQWTFEVGKRRVSVPRAGDEHVYVASGDTVHAVEIDTGKQRWHASWNDSLMAGQDSPPVVTADALYVATYERFYSFDLS